MAFIHHILVFCIVSFKHLKATSRYLMYINRPVLSPFVRYHRSSILSFVCFYTHLPRSRVQQAPSIPSHKTRQAFLCSVRLKQSAGRAASKTVANQRARKVSRIKRRYRGSRFGNWLDQDWSRGRTCERAEFPLRVAGLLLYIQGVESFR